MSIEALAAYSPTTVYGQLTSPFTPKQVTINAHTPYDKIDEDKTQGVYSRSSFEVKPRAKMIYEDMADKKSVHENNEFFKPENEKNILEEYNIIKKPEEFPPKVGNLSTFSSSNLSSNTVLRDSLKQGYSSSEAVIMQKAHDAYERSAILTKEPAEVLSTCSYRVM